MRWRDMTEQQLREIKARTCAKGATVRENHIANKKDLPPKKAKLDPASGVGILMAQIGAERIPLPTKEHRFHPVRKWRFDLAWANQLLAVEVEGGVFTHGRHTRGAGYQRDLVKYNAAQLIGWRVLRYSTSQVKNGTAIEQLKQVFNA
jgi:very-short-patch-repair endonuclease